MIVVKDKEDLPLIEYQTPSHHFINNAVFHMKRCALISPLHWHSAIEFVFILDGSLEFVLDNRSFTAGAGELVVINSSTVHSFSPVGNDVDYYYLVANDDFFKTNNLYSESTHFETVIESEGAKEIFKKITDEYERADEYSNAAILSHLMSLFVYLRRHHDSACDGAPLTEEKKLKMVRGVLAFLQEHFREKLTIDEVADRLHYSKSYLSHTFKEITHYSLISYINLLRCQNATALLLDGASVSEAAADSGFTDLSYFTRVFKKSVGILPSQVDDRIFSFISGALEK